VTNTAILIRHPAGIASRVLHFTQLEIVSKLDGSPVSDCPEISLANCVIST